MASAIETAVRTYLERMAEIRGTGGATSDDLGKLADLLRCEVRLLEIQLRTTARRLR